MQPEFDALLKVLEGGGDAATMSLVYFLYTLSKRLRKVEDKILYIITVMALKEKPPHKFAERD